VQAATGDEADGTVWFGAVVFGEIAGERGEVFALLESLKDLASVSQGLVAIAGDAVVEADAFESNQDVRGMDANDRVAPHDVPTERRFDGTTDLADF